MRRGVRTLGLFALLLATGLLAGCWDYVDIDRQAILLGLGVDRASDGTLSVTLDIANPQSASAGAPVMASGGGSGGGSLVLTERATTLVEALERVEARIDRRLYLPFLQVIVVGEDLARAGTGGLFDFVLRDPRVRSDLCLTLTTESPERIMSFRPTIARDVALWLRFVHNNFRESPRFTRCAPLWTIHAEMQKYGATVVPRIVWREPRPAVDGAGVLAGNRLRGWLSPLETEGTLWWRREVMGGVIHVACRHGRVALEVRESRRRLRVEDEGGSPVLHLDLEGRAAMRQVDPECGLSGREAALSPEVRHGVERAVFERAWAALQAARRLDADFLYVGRLVEQWSGTRGRVQEPAPPTADWIHLPARISVRVLVTEFGQRR